MANRWTEKQFKAIRTNGCNILVAAAAGSGKTAVLVERIIRKITAEDGTDVDRMVVGRFLSDGLAACGLTVFPGEANFLLFRSNDTGLHEKLAEYGIMIRNCDNYRGLSAGYYRVAVKTREASERLLQIITNYTQCEV